MMRLLVVPYVVGVEAQGMGAGPVALAPHAASLPRCGDQRRISLSVPRTTEVAACFDLNRQLAREVRAARTDGALPVVLTGNRHSQQAVVAGLGPEALGLVWLDCHADVNPPETTETGYFDGYRLSMVVGDCWQTLCSMVPGFSALPEDRGVLAGVRDVEEGERRRPEHSSLRRIAPQDTGRLADELAFVDAQRVTLQVDLDAPDPSRGQANQYATKPGIRVKERVEAVGTIAHDRELAAVTVSASDPSSDSDGRVADAARQVHRAAIDSRQRLGAAARLAGVAHLSG